MKKLLIIIMLIMGIENIHAQEFQVEKFEQIKNSPEEVSSMRKDNNGNPCALVLVKSLKEGLEFEGWVMGNVKRVGNEYRVYIAQGCKHLKLKHKDFQTTDVVFDNWNVNSLESGSTYVLKVKDGASEQLAYIYKCGWNLSVEDVSANVKPLIMIDANKGNTKAYIAMALITLQSEPEKASIWIDKILATGDSTCLDAMPGKLQCFFADDLINKGLKSIKVIQRYDADYDVKWYEVYTNASRFYIKAVKKGYKEAGNKLFKTYLSSRGLPEYSKDIITCCEDSVQQGNPQACLCLGVINKNGLGARKDLLSAESCFKEMMNSALKEEALVYLCQVYGDKDYPSNNESITFIQNLADNNVPEALFQIGKMYEEGRYFSKDIQKASEMYEKANLYTTMETINLAPWIYGNLSYTAERRKPYGHVEASCHLARIFLDKKEYKKALEELPGWTFSRSTSRCPLKLPTYSAESAFIRAFIGYYQLAPIAGNRLDYIPDLLSLANQGYQEAIDLLKKENLY